MQRTNTYTAHANEQWQKGCACDWMAAQCAHWNELTYRRRQAYFNDDGDVWAVDTNDLYDKYGPVTGTGTAQQVKRKNDDAWTGFFESFDDYSNGTRETKPERIATLRELATS